MCRDDKPSDEGTPWGEQEELEQSMLRRTGARAAAAGAAAGVGGVQEQFDLVFEDQIDFVNLDAIAGDDLSSRYADSVRVWPCTCRSLVPAYTTVLFKCICHCPAVHGLPMLKVCTVQLAVSLHLDRSGPRGGVSTVVCVPLPPLL